jgi:hypothetical protein
MKSLNPETLIGPGVSGTHPHTHLPISQPPANQPPYSRSLPHHTIHNLPPQKHGSEVSTRRTTREYGSGDHEMVMQVSVNPTGPSSGSYTGSLLPPHPNMMPMASLTINPSAGRGRPKGKAKAKAPTMGDESPEGGAGTRTSPMLSGPSHLLYPQIGNVVPDPLMSVDKSIGSSASPGDLSQAELAPCKPRRGRPPRHEVVPGMGEFTVFL